MNTAIGGGSGNGTVVLPAGGAPTELTWGDCSYPLDARGFLADPGRWNPGFAEGMARRLGMPHGLTVPHWGVVLFVRRFFVRRADVPRIHETCRGCHISWHRLRQLFPQGYQRGVCRLAGIPYRVIADCHFALTYESSVPRTADDPDSPSPRSTAPTPDVGS